MNLNPLNAVLYPFTRESRTQQEARPEKRMPYTTATIAYVCFKGIPIIGKNQRSITSYLPHLSPHAFLPVLLGCLPTTFPHTFSARGALRQPISTRPCTCCPAIAKQVGHVHGTCAVAFDDALGQHELACVHLAVWSSGMILA